jgi:hypothetical protein
MAYVGISRHLDIEKYFLLQEEWIKLGLNATKSAFHAFL